MKWIVKDLHTGYTVGMYLNRNRANNVADRKNLEYGAHRYDVVQEQPK